MGVRLVGKDIALDNLSGIERVMEECSEVNSRRVVTVELTLRKKRYRRGHSLVGYNCVGEVVDFFWEKKDVKALRKNRPVNYVDSEKRKWRQTGEKNSLCKGLVDYIGNTISVLTYERV